ncbi:MAG: long-chain fatty acid--CoA ligase [Ruminococcaceae bacterium]|nr:long-chain fatty acid--CoA ligase [Oscillospiraceae bacterium]
MAATYEALFERSSTLSALIDSISETYGTSVAIHEKKQGFYQHISFGRVGEELSALTAALSGRIVAGSRVLILGKNSYAFVLATLAVAGGVGVAVPLSSGVKKTALARIVKASGITAVLYDDVTAPLVADLDLPCKLSLAAFESLIEEGRGLLLAGTASAVRCPDDAALLFSLPSGKRVLLSHTNLLRMLAAFLKTNLFDARDIFLSHLPLSQATEWVCGVLGPLCCGASVAFAEGTGMLMRNMREIHPTAMVTVPFVAAQIADKFHRLAARRDQQASLQRVWRLTASVKPLAARLAARRRLLATARAPFGGALRTVLTVGGQGEATLCDALCRIGILAAQCYVPPTLGLPLAVSTPRTCRTVGHALSGLTLSVDDNAEIFVQGEALFLGYDGEEPYDGHSLLATGDVGRLDARGLYRIVGRVENRIVRADGTCIFPEELEKMIVDHSHIKQAVVVGLPCDGGHDVEPAALIVPEGAASDDEESVQAQERTVGEWLSRVNGQLPEGAQITLFAIATAPVPCDKRGRVQRHLVVEQLLAATAQEKQSDTKGEDI